MVSQDDDMKPFSSVPVNLHLGLVLSEQTAPRDTEEGHFECSPFGEDRTFAAYPRC